MAAPKQILDEIDDTKGTLMDTMYDVQTTMANIHSTVGELLDSMAEMLNSMSEMKESVLQQQQTITESSQITVIQNLPESPVKQSIPVIESIDEEKKELESKSESESESRYTYLKKIQIEMPIFEGSKVNLWISRAERYFEIGNFTEIEKMKLVYLSVDGEALNWYNFWKIREPFVDWNDFKSRLLNRFGDFEFSSAFERLLHLKQVDSVVDYLSQFEEFASQLSEDTRDFVETLFVNGLKEEIKEVLPLFRHRSKGVKDVIDMARRLENGPLCSMVKKHQSLEYASLADE